jgi:hypothetical protein
MNHSSIPRFTFYNRILLILVIVAALMFSYNLTAHAQPAAQGLAVLTTTPTPTAATGPCVEATKVTVGNAGKTICVTGTVSSVTSDSAATYIKFKNTQFQIISYNLKKNFSVLKNQCIKLTGPITKLSGRPILTLADRIVITDCKGKKISIASTTTLGNAPSATPRPNQPPATKVPTVQPSATPAPSGGTGTTGKIFLNNTSQFDVNFTVWGPADKSFGAAAGTSTTVELPVGNYGWTSFINGCQLVPSNNLPVSSAYTITIEVSNASGECGATLNYGW